MRDNYQDSPVQARDASLRRLGRLTWRTTQIGALAAVGFAVVFARNVPAKTVSVQTPATVKPTAPASAAPTKHIVKPKRATNSPAAQPAATQPAAPAQPAAAPTTPRLTPPTTPPAPAPTSAAPAPTTTSASTGGG